MNSNEIKEIHTQVIVIGAGPGGYTAAFRAADLGKKVVLLERYSDLGGVCLNVGCIPSKALLHAANILEEAKHLSVKGITFGKPKIDLLKLREWVVNNTINKLTNGLKSLAKIRKVQVITGLGEFIDQNTVLVKDLQNNLTKVHFEQAIIAVGSRPIQLPNLPVDPRIMDSTQALTLQEFPNNLLIIGGGIIGMELGTVYSFLGCKVTVVELTKQLLPGADPDLVKIWQQSMEQRFAQVYLNTKVAKVTAHNNHLAVQFLGEYNGNLKFDKILCCVGRKPNSDLIGAANIGLATNSQGFIIVDQQFRTNISHIFAIGDVIGQPMLAHKAIPEGKIVAEIICGHTSAFDALVIPNVAYTIPEISWVGLTEEQCNQRDLNYKKAIFPWNASGRALAMGKAEGLTKILFNPINQQIIGAGIVGENSSELIGEVVMAMEMGATAKDFSACIHPHPTLSETMVQAVELFEGTITDLPNPKSNIL